MKITFVFECDERSDYSPSRCFVFEKAAIAREKLVKVLEESFEGHSLPFKPTAIIIERNNG